MMGANSAAAEVCHDADGMALGWSWVVRRTAHAGPCVDNLADSEAEEPLRGLEESGIPVEGMSCLRRHRRPSTSCPRNLPDLYARAHRHTIEMEFVSGYQMAWPKCGCSVGATYILVSADGLIDITRREFIKLLVVTEDNDGHIDGAEHGQLVGFLEQSTFALEKGAEEAPDVSIQTSLIKGSPLPRNVSLTPSDCGRP